MVKLTLVPRIGREIKIGEFPSLKTAETKIMKLDAAFEENSGIEWNKITKSIPDADVLAHWEGSDVYAEDGYNTWWFVDGWELMK